MAAVFFGTGDGGYGKDVAWSTVTTGVDDAEFGVGGFAEAVEHGLRFFGVARLEDELAMGIPMSERKLAL